MPDTWTKDPDAKLDYSIDWSEWLATGDAILSAAWTVPVGITKELEQKTTEAVTVWLSGGSAGSDYKVACEITTTDARVDERTLTIMVRER